MKQLEFTFMRDFMTAQEKLIELMMKHDEPIIFEIEKSLLARFLRENLNAN